MTGTAQTVLMVMVGAALAYVTRPDSAFAQRALLEVDKGGEKLMEVNEDGGFVVRGTDAVGSIPASGTGARLMWYPRKTAFRVGRVIATEWDDANIGGSSVAMGDETIASGLKATALGAETVASNLVATAMGSNTRASGVSSTAMGFLTEASGSSATAMGRDTKASGDESLAMGAATTASGGSSTAMGSGTTASGRVSTAMGEDTKAIGQRATALGLRTEARAHASTAMGEGTIAGGNAATALGRNTQAVGDYSTAMGSNASAIGRGSFAYGDASTDATVGATENMFAVRASGGIRLRTSPNESTGCDLQSGSGTFNCTSSRLTKEGFEDLDGDVVLERLAEIRIQRWRYRGTEQWHVGPTAEDFYAAFSMGKGPTTISTVDADGISLVGIQALERRTAELQEESVALRAELADLRRAVDHLSASRHEH
jgi:hypothetical protein